jgi:hypothetical protein
MEACTTQALQVSASREYSPWLSCLQYRSFPPGPDGGASVYENVSWYGLDAFPRARGRTDIDLIGLDISSRRQHREGLRALLTKAPAGSFKLCVCVYVCACVWIVWGMCTDVHECVRVAPPPPHRQHL